MRKRYPGCHGLLVAPEEEGLEFGWTAEPPPGGATLRTADRIRRRGGERMIRVRWAGNDRRPAMWVEIWREDGDSRLVVASHGPRLRVDIPAKTVTVETHEPGERLQALAGLGLPILAQDQGGLVLHGSTAVRSGEATIICANSGSGKSTLLVGLLKAGWSAMSEDTTVVYPALRPLTAWPGPSWVRLWEETAGLPRRFELPWKDAWDLRDRMHHHPARIARIIFLDRPAGAPCASLEPLTSGSAIRRLSDHASWMGTPGEAPLTLFPQAAHVAAGIPCYRMAVPREPDWPTRAVNLLSR